MRAIRLRAPLPDLAYRTEAASLSSSFGFRETHVDAFHKSVFSAQEIGDNFSTNSRFDVPARFFKQKKHSGNASPESRP